MKEQTSENKEKQKKSLKNQGSKALQDFGKYSGLAFQMIVIIAVMTFLGIELDKWLNFEKPVFTVVLSLFGVFAGIYTAVKDFLR
ncbi:MAG: AtpZ/AtpI family protein [Bacteroidales bacterium]|nr:AtpZ/AtpI family protein [Bacteroidales bacterium]